VAGFDIGESAGLGGALGRIVAFRDTAAGERDALALLMGLAGLMVPAVVAMTAPNMHKVARLAAVNRRRWTPTWLTPFLGSSTESIPGVLSREYSWGPQPRVHPSCGHRHTRVVALLRPSCLSAVAYRRPGPARPFAPGHWYTPNAASYP